jgi:hypothetical protein
LTFSFSKPPTAKFATLPIPPAQFTLKLRARDWTADDFKELAGITTIQKLILDSDALDSEQVASGPEVDLRGLGALRDLRDLRAVELGAIKLTEKAYAELAELKQLRELRLDSHLTDAALTHVGKLPELEVFDASGFSQDWAQVTAAGIKGLAAAPKLRKVSVLSFPLDDDGCKHLGGMKNLQRLHVFDRYDHVVTVTDEGLRHLAGAAKLSVLSLIIWRSQITDEGLRHLAGKKELTSLRLRYAEVTDEGAKHLAGLTNLRSLDLSDTAISNAALEHLKGLTNLEYLDLRGNNGLTGAGLKSLHELKRLKTLEINGTKMYGTPTREKQLDELRQALPQCEIITKPQYGDP